MLIKCDQILVPEGVVAFNVAPDTGIPFYTPQTVMLDLMSSYWLKPQIKLFDGKPLPSSEPKVAWVSVPVFQQDIEHVHHRLRSLVQLKPQLEVDLH